MMQRGVCALSDISWFHRNGYFKDIWPLNSKGKKKNIWTDLYQSMMPPPPQKKKTVWQIVPNVTPIFFFFLFQFSISTLCVSRRPFLMKSLSYKGTCISRSLPHKTFLLQQQKLLFLLDRPPPLSLFHFTSSKTINNRKKKRNLSGKHPGAKKKKKKVLA